MASLRAERADQVGCAAHGAERGKRVVPFAPGRAGRLNAGHANVKADVVAHDQVCIGDKPHQCRVCRRYLDALLHRHLSRNAVEQNQFVGDGAARLNQCVKAFDFKPGAVEQRYRNIDNVGLSRIGARFLPERKARRFGG